MKKNNQNNLNKGKKKTRYYYLYEKTHNSLLQEAYEKEICVSELLEKKLELLESIRFLILRSEKDATGN